MGLFRTRKQQEALDAINARIEFHHHLTLGSDEQWIYENEEQREEEERLEARATSAIRAYHEEEKQRQALPAWRRWLGL